MGLVPILAGRREEALKPLAESVGARYKVFDLSDTKALDTALQEVSLVLHAAGPFKFTAKPMMDACIRHTNHYIDITGEIQVYEMAKKMDAASKSRRCHAHAGCWF